MTWARLDDTFVDDPDLLRLPRGARLLHVEGIVWSCKHLTDGLLERHVLRRLSDEPDLEEAAGLLVDAGLWADDELGFRIVGFLEQQPSRLEVQQRRENTKERQDRSRRHRSGDHSTCLRGRYCPEGAVTRDTTGDETRQSPRPVPTRPDPSRPEGKGREGTHVVSTSSTTCVHGKRLVVAADGGSSCIECDTLPAQRSA